MSPSATLPLEPSFEISHEAPGSASVIPGTLWLLAGGVSLRLAGGIWDLSWHSSIGLDSYFVWPHLLMQSGAWLAGAAALYAIVIASMAGRSRRAETSVRVAGMRGPGGAFVVLWGVLATMAAATSDNWWHQAYGDTTVATPPHLLLAVGFFALQVGAVTWIAGVMHHAVEPLRRRLAWLLLWVASTGVAQLSGFMPGNASAHTAAYYLTFAVFIPTWLIAAGWATELRFGCTIVTSFYSAIMLAAQWLLPLFPAAPKLGPVYHAVTHMVPTGFPLLFVVPAVIADVLRYSFKTRFSWLKGLCVGPAVVLSFLLVQWPFASFLMLPAARNRIFGAAEFAFSDTAGFLYDPYRFEVAEKTLAEFVTTLAVALAISVLTTVVGIAWANWLRRVCR